MIAFVFPGQGSQKVGMGAELAEASAAARAVFEEVDEALAQHLFRLMREGPEDDLTSTINAQPAIMAHALAVARTLEDGGISLAARGAAVAGHSLGEYAALSAVGAFCLADAARLLRLRGEAMQDAVPVGVGAMCAVLGADLPRAEALAEASARAAAGATGGQAVCQVANDNDPGQIVLSGHLAAIEAAVDLAREHGFKRAIRLAVSAPFHCALMQPAAERMAQALADCPPRAFTLPIYANITAEEVSDPAIEQRLLVEQVTGRVRWRESIAAMHGAGIGHFVELGGKVLGPMIRKIAPEAKVTSVVSIAEIEALAKEIG